MELEILEEASDSFKFNLNLLKGKIHSKVGYKSSEEPGYYTTALGVRGTEFMVVQEEEGENFLAGIFMKEGSLEVDLTNLKNCDFDSDMGLFRIRTGCDDDTETVILNAGKQILFYEEDYVISDLESYRKQEMEIIDTFGLMDIPLFHSIRQEYFDVGSYTPADYNLIDFSSPFKEEEKFRNSCCKPCPYQCCYSCKHGCYR